jgi:MFS family permease
MDGETATKDLEYIRTVLARAHRRIDPHAFHFVHWGAIVLAQFPLANLLDQQGRKEWLLPLGVSALVLGSLLSAFREIRLSRRPRLPGEDSFIGLQIQQSVWVCIGAAIVVNIAGPATGFIQGDRVPVVWGIAYAAMAAMVGIVYSREYLWSGMAIFAGSILAMALPGIAGFILGPFMGLGMIVPGVMAERRVSRLSKEEASDGPVAG